jgi:hypothetical protein
VTAGQLTLADCDPDWAEALGAEPQHTPARRPHRDLRGQRLHRRKKYRITDVHVVGEYL